MAEDIAWHIWVGVTVTIVPATILVAIRFLARTTGSPPSGIKVDDWLILASLVSNISVNSMHLALRCPNTGMTSSCLGVGTLD